MSVAYPLGASFRRDGVERKGERVKRGR